MEDLRVEALVLLVEDDEPVRLGMHTWLRDNQYGYTVMTANNGLRALEMIERYRPDMVVSDIRMPEMDGLQLLVTCRRRYPEMKFVVMSAFGTPELEEASRRYGAVRFLHKPLDMERLERGIAEVLTQRPDEERSGFLSGVSIPGFLQLLSVERKSVCLKLKNKKGQSGCLYLYQGELVNAELDDYLGAGAAMDLLAWDDAEMEIESLDGEPMRSIEESLPNLIMESLRLKDESDH